MSAAIPGGREAWLDRYAQQIAKQIGWTLHDARTLIAEADDFETISEGYEDDPEGAADEQMSYWEAD